MRDGKKTVLSALRVGTTCDDAWGVQFGLRLSWADFVWLVGAAAGLAGDGPAGNGLYAMRNALAGGASGPGAKSGRLSGDDFDSDRCAGDFGCGGRRFAVEEGR